MARSRRCPNFAQTLLQAMSDENVQITNFLLEWNSNRLVVVQQALEISTLMERIVLEADGFVDVYNKLTSYIGTVRDELLSRPPRFSSSSVMAKHDRCVEALGAVSVPDRPGLHQERGVRAGAPGQ